MYVLTELGYVLICHVKEKRKKKCSFENALVEKSESSTRNKKWISRRIVIIFNLSFLFYSRELALCLTIIADSTYNVASIVLVSLGKT